MEVDAPFVVSVRKPSLEAALSHPVFFYFSALVLLLGIIFIVTFGYLGIAREGGFAENLAYFITAGHLWSAGVSLYEYSVFSAAVSVVPGFDPRSTSAYTPTISWTLSLRILVRNAG